MGDIVTFRPRPRPAGTDPAREASGDAQIVFFPGIRYERYIEASPETALESKPRKTTARPAAAPRARPRKRPA